jgi:CheY-like chemotaxis protein
MHRDLAAEDPVSATILVVDDDLDIQEMLQLVLGGAGRDVAAASNGREALALLRKGENVSLVLLDLMMPVMNGFEFLTELAKDPVHASVPVVAVTGAGPSVLAALPPSMGILRKPFTVDELLHTVERYEQDQHRDRA